MSALLEELLGRFGPHRAVRVVYTDNTYTMSRVGRRNGRLTFRLHKMFRAAPREVLEALVRLHFFRSPRSTRRRLVATVRRYIDENASAIRARPGRPRKQRLLEPRGIFVNLAAIFEEMNERYFGGRVRAGITWSRSINRRQMGCCHDGQASGQPVIVINRLFDDPEVPRYYLDFLVVHEILHCIFPRRTENGRTVRHPRELRAFEKKLPFHRPAIAWEKEQVDRLYRRRKTGRLAQMPLPFLR